MSNDRFFFMHIMKTGGTSFLQHAQQSLDRSRIYPGPAFCDSDADLRAAKLSADRLVGPDGPPPESVSLYTVHLPLWTRDALGQDLVTITVVRDPVERTISHIRHMARGELEGRSLEEIYDIHGPGLLRNYQIGQFSLTGDEWEATNERRRVWYTRRAMGRTDLQPDGATLPMDDARFERAVDRLREIDVLATLDELEALAAVMTERFGWKRQPSATANSAGLATNSEPEPVPGALRAKIESDNGLEVEFYRIAREVSRASLRLR